MNYSIRFYVGCNYFDKVDEIIINYDYKDAELINFVQKYPDKRIVANTFNLEGFAEDSVDIFKAVREVHPNFAVMCKIDEDITKLKGNNIPFFYISGANSYDEVRSMIEAGVSDIYIENELCFDLPRIAEYCHHNEVKVRVIPNVAQTKSRLPMNDMRKFFIRPEAIELYEDIIDVIEVQCKVLTKQPTVIQIYKDGHWNGDLKILIGNFKESIDNRVFLPAFDEYRMVCKKKCNVGKCNLCNTCFLLGKTLETKEIIIKRG